MATYRRKVEVEAVQAQRPGILQSPDGDCPYLPGDWILTLRNGDNYVCKATVFPQKFELAMPPAGKSPQR